MWQQILKNNNFEIFIKKFKISIIIFRTFDNREINFKIDNEIKKLIEAEIETILILNIFTLNFDNLILIFEEIIKIIRVVY